jgi:hypothetical protein
MKEILQLDTHFPDEVSRLMLPERQFWTDDAAQRFLDDDGHLKTDIEPLQKPLLDEGKYGSIVDIPALATQLRSLFAPGYRFPRTRVVEAERALTENGYTASKKTVAMVCMHDNVDHVQQQKLYKGLEPDSDERRLCYSPERQWELPQRAHLVLTQLYEDLDVVDPDAARAHRIGAKLCLNLFEYAVLYQRRHYGVESRMRSIANGTVKPMASAIIDGCDLYSREYFKESNKTIDQQYEANLLSFVTEMPEESYFDQLVEPIAQAEPHEVVAILGRVATPTPWRYSQYMRGGIDLDESLQAHSDHLAERTISDSRLVV